MNEKIERKARKVAAAKRMSFSAFVEIAVEDKMAEVIRSLGKKGASK